MKGAASILATGLVLLALGAVAPANATQVQRESDIVNLRLGQRIKVDDGSCPAGQIKEVVGVSLTPNGVARSRGCVSRRGAR